MGNSRWNNGSSITIADLSQVELKEAMKEWAEGCQELEELLWNCHNNGVVTLGCDAGEHHCPYVQFDIEASTDKLKDILNAAWGFGNIEVCLKFAGNPFAGPNWYKCTVGLFPKLACQASEFFNYLSQNLKDVEEVEASNDFGFAKILTIYELLDDKESDLSFYFEKVGDKYSITVECYGNSHNWEPFSEIFESAGLSKVQKEGTGIVKWIYYTQQEEEFNIAIVKLSEVLKDKWNLSLPSVVTKDMTLVSVALMKRRKFGTEPEGIKLFNEWLEETRRSWFKQS